MKENKFGCLVGIIILILCLISYIEGCSTRSKNQNTTLVNVVTRDGKVSQMYNLDLKAAKGTPQKMKHRNYDLEERDYQD